MRVFPLDPSSNFSTTKTEDKHERDSRLMTVAQLRRSRAATEISQVARKSMAVYSREQLCKSSEDEG